MLVLLISINFCSCSLALKKYVFEGYEPFLTSLISITVFESWLKKGDFKYLKYLAVIFCSIILSALFCNAFTTQTNCSNLLIIDCVWYKTMRSVFLKIATHLEVQ